ncbi:hook-length control protein FliK [Lachnospiraceae bacterium XBB2008]|nr:hook-length control protein FliK [Lachnospiraceae bacterium XBB2008]
MTTVPVTDLGLRVPTVNETGGTPPVNGQDFMGKFRSAIESQASALNIEQAQPQDTTQTRTSTQTDEAPKEVDRTPKASPDRESVKSNVEKQPTKTGKDEVTAEDAEKEAETISPETVEVIEEAVEQIVNEIAQMLDLTPEEVQSVIDDMGLTTADLLDPVNMTGLVTKLSGNQDAVALLTDDSLYQTLGTLQEFVTDTREDLMDKLDLSQEALNEVLIRTEEPVQQPSEADMDPIPAEPIPAEVKPAVENPLEGMKDYKMTTTVDGETVTMDVRVDDTTGAQTVTDVTRSDPQQSEQQRQPSEQNFGQETKREDSPEVPLFTQTTTQLNTENIQDFTAMTEEVTGFRTEAADIAEQIMESMRANIRADVTELEMNLHPASLGNVRVNLQAQNGQITAQFLAQNETVRAAIESQVVQLRESLEAQGIKIEQVEVAVASQGFDRNRDNSQGQGGSADNGQQPGGRIGRAGRIRRIDLNAMEGEEMEDLDDADRIAAEMMASEGNTVDYTV